MTDFPQPWSECHLVDIGEWQVGEHGDPVLRWRNAVTNAASR